ncbi:cysteine and O-acetyl-L-serine efflux system [Legionella sainthelensi]|uniref:Cysteine and O-acetyl-L-serine efflux system n=1 Tax=Legionella sainthelensi TaxID=28087 RepID=A0A0W0YJW4_9GAMM|nr:EamA family transporter [Legionella sainthelensi]KTD56854.1 cysteine and O-acetyl-L-serine efflux system [Legionella sainthelensi]VEH37071.1 cysteine and O-acetyl-L-serine efflux system [Legionella sainthelensi]
MPLPHLLLALLVVLIWGVNFLFVSIGLEEISPLLLCALRFLLSSIPAIFFVKLPKSSFKIIALYGFIMFALQFSFLFIGMNAGMPAGMASLLMQTQVFFSMFFAIIFLGEQPNIAQILGALVAFTGIGLVAMHFDSDISVVGFLCIIAAAATWGVGNLITKKIKGNSNHMMAIIAWGSFIACIPMFLLSWIFEGPSSFAYTYENLSWRGTVSLFYIVFASTWIGYGVWNWLIARYPVGVVAPFTLLVPIVAIVSSVVVLGEPFQLWKLAAGLLVIGGLCISILGTRFLVLKQQPEIA